MADQLRYTPRHSTKSSIRLFGEKEMVHATIFTYNTVSRKLYYRARFILRWVHRDLVSNLERVLITGRYKRKLIDVYAQVFGNVNATLWSSINIFP